MGNSVSKLSLFILLNIFLTIFSFLDSKKNTGKIDIAQVSGGNFDPNDGNFSNFPEI